MFGFFWQGDKRLFILFLVIQFYIICSNTLFFNPTNTIAMSAKEEPCRYVSPQCANDSSINENQCDIVVDELEKRGEGFLRRLYVFVMSTLNLPEAQCNKTALDIADRSAQAYGETGGIDINALKVQFDKYCSDSNGEKVMTIDQFVDCLGEKPGTKSLDKERMKFMFAMADENTDGFINFDEFVIFQHLLSKPDADYELAFRLFDTDGNGQITFQEFTKIIEASTGPHANVLPFDYDSEWVHMYFGRKKQRSIYYTEFTQLIKELHRHRIVEAFKLYDKSGNGKISRQEFVEIENILMAHKMSPHVIKHLHLITDMYKGKSISFAMYTAFNNLLFNLDMAENILDDAIDHKLEIMKQRHVKNTPDLPFPFTRRTVRITKEDFMRSATRVNRFDQLTPMEVDILFYFCDVKAGSGTISRDDFYLVIPVDHWPLSRKGRFSSTVDPEIAKKKAIERMGVTGMILTQATNFAMGAIAGGIGATAVYPIDLVKTRMQNQRSVVVGEVLYKNSLDCFKKVIKNEGILGLYRGLGPQLVGVAPEKAIKLTVNDLFRDVFKNKETGEIPVPLQALAGGLAGASQVVFTNPLEIVKIRLQVAGEESKLVSGPQKLGAISVIRQLGLLGLYKGAAACLLRDVPFSAIYFPTYAAAKKKLCEDGQTNSASSLLLAGAIAGMPAASLTTPADVIKTRLQVEARAGQETYSGIMDCFRKICASEGPKALFKGAAARVFRSSPQFGVTLLSYELLQKYFDPMGLNQKWVLNLFCLFRLRLLTIISPLAVLLGELLHNYKPWRMI